MTAQVDVRDYDGLKAAVDSGVEQLGRLDIIVANAGVGTDGRRLHKIRENVWQDMIDINLSGVPEHRAPCGRQTRCHRPHACVRRRAGPGHDPGRKVMLSVEYRTPAPSLHTDLFVKFSRDLAWFWRDSDGRWQCGLMDWGCVSQMNLGMAIRGAMSGAETGMWSEHLDGLLLPSVSEFHRSGGPEIDPDRLRRHTVLDVAAMRVAWLLDVPALMRTRFGADPPETRTDPRIRERHRPGQLLDAALAER